MADNKFIQIVFSNPAEGKDDEFNEWYDNVHIPDLLAIPGMLSAQRYKLHDAEIYRMEGGNQPEHGYLLIYEMEGDVDAIMQKIQENVAAGKISMARLSRHVQLAGCRSGHPWARKSTHNGSIPGMTSPSHTEETTWTLASTRIRLGGWLDQNDAPGQGEQPDLKQLAGGSQNSLFLVTRGDSRMVLRMPGARATDKRLNELLREIRLVRALKGTDVPHAELIAADESGTLLGKPFYVMAEIDGWSPMDGGSAATVRHRP